MRLIRLDIQKNSVGRSYEETKMANILSATNILGAIGGTGGSPVTGTGTSTSTTPNQWQQTVSAYPPRCGSVLNPPPGQWIDCELGCRRGIEDLMTCYYTDIYGKTALVIEATDLTGFDKLRDYRLSHYVVAMCKDCARRAGLIW